jgi:hypothetical protein
MLVKLVKEHQANNAMDLLHKKPSNTGCKIAHLNYKNDDGYKLWF